MKSKQKATTQNHTSARAPRGVGRPSEGRTKLVNFKTTPENAERYRAAADARDCSFREWVEQACERQLMADSLAEAKAGARAMRLLERVARAGGE